MNSLQRLIGFSLACCSLVFFSACATHKAASYGAYQDALKGAGLTAISPPLGDPRNWSDWNQFGPGAIVRRGAYDYEHGAHLVVGDAQVSEWAKNWDKDGTPSNSPYKLASGGIYSGYDIDPKGGYSFAKVWEASAELHLTRDTSITFDFGNARIARFEIESLASLLDRHKTDIAAETRRNVRNGKSDVILDVVYTPSLHFYFNRNGSNSSSVVLKLSAQQIANLMAKGYRVENGAIVSDTPVFIAYRRYDNAAQHLAR